ncbi:MAG: helix-turn-helix transcriptional regulator [Bdellovibrionales bacterium]
MGNYGLIIKRLRTMNGHTIRSAAQKIGKSTGWLSEIENNRGKARLSSQEFDRIVTALGGEKHRCRFKNWVIADRTVAQGDRSLDGAILKYFRMQKKISLLQASQKIGISKSYLTNIENGHKPITLGLRDRIMIAYGYCPSSFRNMTEDKRGYLVPIQYKLRILLNQLSPEQLNYVFKFIINDFEAGASLG